MKLDKQTLVKHRFWASFCLLLPLIVIAVAILSTAVASNLDKRNQDVKDLLGRLSGQKNLNGPKEYEELQQQTAEMVVRRKEVWDKAWNEQEKLMAWPPGLPKEEKGLKQDCQNLRFGEQFAVDPTDLRPESNFCEKYSKVYPDFARKQQLQIFKRKVKVNDKIMEFEPTYFLGGWQKAGLRMVVHKDNVWPKLPTFEEVWLAQEDVMVQRELLLAIKQANDYVAKFSKVEGAAKPANKELVRQRFVNPCWQLDLTLARKGDLVTLGGKIKNLTKRRQQLGRLYFLVKLGKAGEPVPLVVDGEALAAGQEIDIPENLPVKASPPEGLLEVEQLLDIRTSPVRRIDKLAWGQQSQKPGPGGALQNPRFTKGGGATDNGLTRPRYSETNEFLRRIPMGLQLVVDQERIPEVLAALSNSKLLFHINQVHWQHFRGGLDPAPAEDADKPPAPAAKEAAAAAPVSSGGDEGTGSLVELSVYGIITLYERPSEPTKK